MSAGAALALMLTAAPAAAQEGPQPFLADSETIESEISADLNSDGVPDRVAIIRSGEEISSLRVAISLVDGAEIGVNRLQELALDPFPNGITGITVEGDVLTLNEPTGGSTVVYTTYRFRWDTSLAAMRLIEIDTLLYSRSFGHDARGVKWNLLTGDLVTEKLRLNTRGGDAAYDKPTKRKSHKPSPPVRLEDTSSGDYLLWPEKR